MVRGTFHVSGRPDPGSFEHIVGIKDALHSLVFKSMSANSRDALFNGRLQIEVIATVRTR